MRAERRARGPRRSHELRHPWLLALGLALLLLLAPSPRVRAEPSLQVGVKQAPPFALRGPDGAWTGLAVELWRQIAQDLGLVYELQEVDLAELFDGLVAGSLDVGVGALTVTAEREDLFDFSHPIHSSGLGVAVAAVRRSTLGGVLRRLASPEFFSALAGLLVVLLGAGALVWALERRRNPEQFGGPPAQGIGSGFWWAAVTMTTVGYGDKAPRTASGRAVALVWMFFSVITISGFTAAIASTLTVSRLESPVRSPADLARVRVGTLEGTTGAAYLQQRRIGYRTYPDAAGALAALERGDVEAVVYDAPLLRYLVRRDANERLEVLPFVFERQVYAFGLAPDSPLRESVNRTLLRQISSGWWEELVRRDLGD